MKCRLPACTDTHHCQQGIWQYIIGRELWQELTKIRCSHQSEGRICVRNRNSEIQFQNEAEDPLNPYPGSPVLPPCPVSEYGVVTLSVFPEKLKVCGIRLSVRIGLEDVVRMPAECVAITKHNSRTVSAVRFAKNGEKRPAVFLFAKNFSGAVPAAVVDENKPGFSVSVMLFYEGIPGVYDRPYVFLFIICRDHYVQYIHERYRGLAGPTASGGVSHGSESGFSVHFIPAGQLCCFTGTGQPDSP